MSGRLRWTGLLIGLVLGVGLAGTACDAAEDSELAQKSAEAQRSEDKAAKADEPGKTATAAATASGTPETWHATAFVSGIGSYRIIHYWSKGPSMRAETLIGGHPVATLVHGDRYVVIDRLTGQALDVERSPGALAEDAGRARPFAFEQREIREAGGEKVEDAKLSGVDVEVWRVTDDAGRRTAWVSKGEPGVPLRVETFVRGGAQTVKIDYSSWGFNLEMPDAFFALPGGLEVERLSYDDYTKKSAEGPVGPAPILYPDMLHGSKPQ
ncbi:MAG: hypothetical protein IPK00_21295 [Deltaproteobacteria bacterium]|nr:hypothetical protein [Deltaproteobacteria bacterium]